MNRLGLLILGLGLLLGACGSDPLARSLARPIPDVVSLRYGQAVDALAAEGFCVGTVVLEPNNLPSGTVLAQSPRAGHDRAGPGYLIGVRVSAGPNIMSGDLQTLVARNTPSGCILPDVIPADRVGGYWWSGETRPPSSNSS